MKPVLRAARAAVLALLLAVGVSAQGVTFTDHEQAQCAAGGGCVTLTRKSLEDNINAAFMAGAKAGRAAGEEDCLDARRQRT